ncbi:hypothetical protein JAAARDRAFT_536074 [Jaapia argillacea MUCL 33604]|uniref:Uncharacterized protein n=1 Tax=Jaapia argillacea MUCL 33604 TaxID=933084 RepID=A0A067P8M1_9AGAM|nr:hypothetical protein JAAARDRAFT_536074 [Jaapia argillacea MUCL 33604]
MPSELSFAHEAQSPIHSHPLHPVPTLPGNNTRCQAGYRLRVLWNGLVSAAISVVGFGIWTLRNHHWGVYWEAASKVYSAPEDIPDRAFRVLLQIVYLVLIPVWVAIFVRPAWMTQVDARLPSFYHAISWFRRVNSIVVAFLFLFLILRPSQRNAFYVGLLIMIHKFVGALYIPKSDVAGVLPKIRSYIAYQEFRRTLVEHEVVLPFPP